MDYTKHTHAVPFFYNLVDVVSHEDCSWFAVSTKPQAPLLPCPPPPPPIRAARAIPRILNLILDTL